MACKRLADRAAHYVIVCRRHLTDAFELIPVAFLGAKVKFVATGKHHHVGTSKLAGTDDFYVEQAKRYLSTHLTQETCLATQGKPCKYTRTFVLYMI